MKKLSLTTWILIALVAGIVFGAAFPAAALKLKLLGTIFLRLIKSIIAPLTFATLVCGIAGTGSVKTMGRIGGKAIVYFEIVTTAALFVGLVAVNLVKPGVGVELHKGAAPGVPQANPGFAQILEHTFPTSIFDAMARGEVLQIVVFSILFGTACAAIGAKSRPVVAFCESLTEVMFRYTNYVMLFAPFGVFGAMASTVGDKGIVVLVNLGKLVLTLYGALIFFVVVVLGAVAIVARVPIKKFLKAVREPFVIAFATTSSESALPKAMEAMERLGVPARIVGFVMPTGYSFNLDGTTLYLAMASVFVAQAAEATTGQHMGLGQQLVMMLTLMLTSKGVAAVPRAALVILLATLHTFNLPIEGVAIIFGIDELMDMGRTSVNVLGNCMATVVVSRWEGEFDDERARVFGTPEEAKLDLEHGELAFAEAAAEGD